jgi:hypothetical protein
MFTIKTPPRQRNLFDFTPTWLATPTTTKHRNNRTLLWRSRGMICWAKPHNANTPYIFEHNLHRNNKRDE